MVGHAGAHRAHDRVGDNIFRVGWANQSRGEPTQFLGMFAVKLYIIGFHHTYDAAARRNPPHGDPANADRPDSARPGSPISSVLALEGEDGQLVLQRDRVASFG